MVKKANKILEDDDQLTFIENGLQVLFEFGDLLFLHVLLEVTLITFRYVKL